MCVYIYIYFIFSILRGLLIQKSLISRWLKIFVDVCVLNVW